MTDPILIDNQDSLIEVELLDSSGNTEGTFSPQQGQSFAEAAEENGLSLPVSCCSWACFVCACRVVSGQEDVDIGLLSVPLVDIDKDQVLTCVGGLKDHLFWDGKYHKIVLQKLI